MNRKFITVLLTSTLTAAASPLQSLVDRAVAERRFDEIAVGRDQLAQSIRAEGAIARIAHAAASGIRNLKKSFAFDGGIPRIVRSL